MRMPTPGRLRRGLLILAVVGPALLPSAPELVSSEPGPPGEPAAIPQLDFKRGKAPPYDGLLAPLQWEDAPSLSIPIDAGWSVTVYYKHDGKNLYFAFTNLMRSGKEVYPEILLDMGGNRGLSWDGDDWWLHASYNDCEGRGRSNVWESCTPTHEGWKANNFPLESPGTVEIKISYELIGLRPAGGKPFGVTLAVTDTKNLWRGWPAAARLENPSTWGYATASTGWE